MATENEPAKLLLPYLQRADELQKHEPLVAYYCRLYAMEKGLRVPQGERTKTTNALLVSLMKQLEKDKKSLKLEPDDNLHIEGFALNVFAKADKQDHAGRADINTAKTFYAASIFFEILNQFGPLQPDLEQKQKYAVWKAADIRKAIKDGRKPIAGPPSDDEDLSLPSNKTTYDRELGENVDTHPQTRLDPSPPFYQKLDQNHPPTISPSPSFHDSTNHPNSTNIPHPTNFYEDVNSNIPPSPPIYQRANYNSHEFHPPPSNEPDNSIYSQSYHQPYPQEPRHLPHNNHLPHETSPYNYPHFQSYPSFTDSTLPSVPSQSLPPVPSHSPSYYQESDSFYTSQQVPSTNYPSASQNHISGRDGMPSEAGPSAPKSYQYNSEYTPPPEKIAEAHKAARFAVGALAFDDVSVAVDYLIKSLDLLTNPSASH